MANRLFALASVTALAGAIVAVEGGCLGEPPIGLSDKGAGGGGSGDGGGTAGDGNGTAGIDGGTATDGSVPTDGAAAATCPSTAPIDATKFAYKPAATPSTACTAAEIEELITFVDTNKTATLADVKLSVTNTTCRACLVTLDTDATWGAIVEDAAGKVVLINSAGCIEAKSGKLECGVAYHRFERCLEEACVACPAGNDIARAACYKAAAKGACKSANVAITSDCDDALSTCDDLSTKYTFEGPAKALCAGL